MCAPVEKQGGTVLVAVEDPHDLMRQDAIKAMNLAPRCDFVVGLRATSSTTSTAATAWPRRAVAEAQDMSRIIMELGSGSEDEVEGGAENAAARDRRERAAGW